MPFLTRFTSLEKDTTRMNPIKSAQKGLKHGWTRATFILRDDHLEKIKDLAYWKRNQVKEVMDEVLSSYLKGRKIKSRRNK